MYLSIATISPLPSQKKHKGVGVRRDGMVSSPTPARELHVHVYKISNKLTNVTANASVKVCTYIYHQRHNKHHEHNFQVRIFNW